MCPGSTGHQRGHTPCPRSRGTRSPSLNCTFVGGLYTPDPSKAIFVADSSPCCSVLNIHALASFQNCQKTALCVTLGEWWNVVTTVEVVAARGPPCPCFVPVWDSCGL